MVYEPVRETLVFEVAVTCCRVDLSPLLSLIVNATLVHLGTKQINVHLKIIANKV